MNFLPQRLFKFYLFVFFSLTGISMTGAQTNKTIDLKGIWRFDTDRKDT